jgi:tryptophanyl-tRNA synthetase
LEGGYGYGHAKQALFEQLLDTFKDARLRFDHYMAHKNDIDFILEEGANRAQSVADSVLQRVRSKLGYRI